MPPDAKTPTTRDRNKAIYTVSTYAGNMPLGRKKIKTVRIDGMDLDAIDVKNLVVTRGVRVDPAVYEACEGKFSLSRDARKLSCLVLSNGYVAALYDMAPQVDQMARRFLMTDLEKDEFASQKVTPLSIKMDAGKFALTYNDQLIDYVTFPTYQDFYDQTTSSNLPFLGNVSILGNASYLVFPYEWSCDFAAAGFPCQYCHSGHETAAQKRHDKPVKTPLVPQDITDIVNTTMRNDYAVSILYTGGSTFDGAAEYVHFKSFIEAMEAGIGRQAIPGQILFYLTPPQHLEQLDYYVNAGIDKLGMSVEVWDERIAEKVTPGKIRFTTRERHLRALEYVAKRFGGHHAFCQIVIGCEPVESAIEGARWLAERGITPVYSILQQHGLKINGSTAPPSIDVFRRAKEAWFELYARYDIVPAGREYSIGCIESEFYDEVHGVEHKRYPRTHTQEATCV